MGEWKKAEISYLKANRAYCDLCGQLVPARVWAATIDGEEKIFCNPDHERVYHEYWLPRCGKAASR